MNAENPIDKFQKWWASAKNDSPLNQKSPVCVSTIGNGGFPNSRFVDLKAVNDQGFIFCTASNSVKGQEISQSNKVAMAIWWDHVGYQVRVRGTANPISEGQARHYWSERSAEAQLATVATHQSAPANSGSSVAESFERAVQSNDSGTIPKPPDWGGYIVVPHEIEFLTFNENRLHLREQYQYFGGHWHVQFLQP